MLTDNYSFIIKNANQEDQPYKETCKSERKCSVLSSLLMKSRHVTLPANQCSPTRKYHWDSVLRVFRGAHYAVTRMGAPHQKAAPYDERVGTLSQPTSEQGRGSGDGVHHLIVIFYIQLIRTEVSKNTLKTQTSPSNGWGTPDPESMTFHWLV